MAKYSVIILFKQTEEEIRLSNLKYQLFNRFHGASAIELPPHITLMKWESKELIPITLAQLIHFKDITCDVLIETIELPLNVKAIWYKVAISEELLDISNSIYALLLNIGVPKNNITLTTSFHLTLAYKDYSEKEIVEINSYLKQLEPHSYFKLSADKTAICKIGEDDQWSIMQTFHEKNNKL